MNLKWPNIIRSIRDHKNPLSCSPLAAIVNELHREFVDKLYEHRSDLIHHSADFGTAHTTHHIKEGKIDFFVFSPRRITSRFHELKELSQTNRITLIYVAFWICEKTINSSLKLIDPLIRHIEINRKTRPGSEIFILRGSAKQRTHNTRNNDGGK
jgi:hypothetical protein